MNDWMELERALSAIAASGHAELREDGRWLPEFSPLRCKLRQSNGNAFLDVTSDAGSLTRRILRIKEHSQQRLVLEVHRFGKKSGRLEIIPRPKGRPPSRIVREQFCSRFERLLRVCFPDAEIEPFTCAPDLERSFSPRYARGKMSEGGCSWAVLAASRDENSATIDAILAFGIVWFDYLRNSATKTKLAGLRIFVPLKCAQSVRERVAGLAMSIPTEIFEFDETASQIQKVDPADVGNLESRLIPRRDNHDALALTAECADRIRGLFTESPNEFSVRIAAGNEISFSFRGLEFARWAGGEMFCGSGRSRQRMTPAKLPQLEKIVRDLQIYRQPSAARKNHALYRSAPERWLETIVQENPTSLDAQLDERFIYSQTPAFDAGDRGVLDLLGVTRNGRLVIMELKATEDIQMPLQALDYWFRVRRHQRDGSFQEYGYFVGKELSPEPPLIFLVAPALHFHPATDLLLKYLAPEICVTKIGLAENWRRGLKIMFRQATGKRA